MKKILAILTVLFAVSVATSCVKPYELTEPLTVDNYDLTIPKTANKKGINGENIHYFCITATGPWEASLELQNSESIWCWLQDYYSTAAKDEYGNQIKDEYGRVQTVDIPVAEGVELFDAMAGGEEGSAQNLKYRVVRGKAGTTYLPMQYNDNAGSQRFATLRVRRTDMDYEKFINITQSK